MDNLYNRLNSLRIRKGVSGGKMARDNGLSQNFLTEIKMGRKKSMSAETARKLADYFGVSVQYLLGYDDEETKKTAPIRAVTRDISDEEYDLIKAYRAAPAPIQAAIDGLVEPYKKVAKQDAV